MWWKIALVTGLLGLLVALGSAALHHARLRGQADARAEIALQNAKEAQERVRREAEVMRLSDPDLDDRLSRWMRD